jgi:hypothetical protein
MLKAAENRSLWSRLRIDTKRLQRHTEHREPSGRRVFKHWRQPAGFAAI